MSSLETMLSQLKDVLAERGVSEPEATAKADHTHYAQEAAAALQEFLATAKVVAAVSNGSGGSDSPEITTERLKALEAFVGVEIVHQPNPPARGIKSGGSHSKPAHGGHGHAPRGGHSSHSAAHSKVAASGGHTAEQGEPHLTGDVAAGSPSANGPDASPPGQTVQVVQVICPSCVERERSGADAAPATPPPAPVAPAPVAPTPALAAPGVQASNFQWKRHIAAVETALRNKELPVAESLLKVLNEVAEVIPVEVAVKLRLTVQLANISIEKGEIEESMRSLLRALQSVEGTEHKRSVATAYCLDSLAACYQAQEKFDQGEKARRAAVIISEELLGAEHPDAAYFRERLEELRNERALATLGNDEGSRTLLDKLTDAYNAAAANGEAPAAAEARPSDGVSGFMYEKYVSNGKNALNQKNWREAESALRSAYEKGQGVADNDPRKCEGIRMLAQAMDVQGKHAESKQFYEEALTLAFKFIGWNDIQVAHCCAALAELHVKLSDIGTAKNYYKQAIAAYTLCLGKDDPATTSLQATYATFLERAREERKWKGWSA